MTFKATFNQSVEGIESVEVFVEADDVEEAAHKIEVGDYHRYRVLNNDLARIKLLGTVRFVEYKDD